MKKITSFALPLVFFLQVALGQGKMLDTLVRKFDHYRVNSLQEKIYAHLDRNFYLTGETLWFKIYVVDGSFHKPLNVSKVAYVEILDEANLSVLQAKVELADGSGSGSFFLPATLSSGNYKFRLYTKWMKNFSAEFYFHKNITIVNPFLKLEPARDSVAPTHVAQFFPEGGNLVAGIQSKVAFKISDASGKGIPCKGYLLNENNDTLTSFTPVRFGIGNFLFTPTAYTPYKVIIRDERGKTSTHPFTTVLPSGYVLHLQDSGKFLRITVTAKAVKSPYIYLFVHARQIIARAEVQLLRENEAVFTIDKSNLAEGISHFTAFNEQLEPICERLYFTWPGKLLNIDIKTSQKEYAYRKRVAISIQTSNPPRTPAPANLSLAAFKIDSLSTHPDVGIFHHLWLKSDLVGTIESPEYYFNLKDARVAEAMDNLMLTHGWRKFDWKRILDKPEDILHLPEYTGHIITGVVTNTQGKQPRILTYLGSPGKIVRAYGSRSNHRGEVRFDSKNFYGPRKLIIQTVDDSTHNYTVKVQDPFSASFDQDRVTPFHIHKDAETALLSRSIAMQVQDVYYYDQYGNRFINPVVDSSAFYGEADATYYLDDYTRFQVMEEVMREYVPGVLVRKRKDGFHFIMVDAVNGGILKGDPMILLDGVPLFDADKIMQIDPLLIKKLEVVKRQYFLGHADFSGILSYSTYQGDLRGLELNPGSVSLNYDGLQLKREFFSPQYGPGQTQDRMPDQRYLLHWDPDIKTDAQGKQQVEFYTSDVPGRYAVLIEGLSREGCSGSTIHTFTVKQSGDP